MTAQEFNYQFEVLYNNITSNQGPGLNTYEKSVFLTKALDELIKNYFRILGNPKLEGYLNGPIRDYDFGKLITTIDAVPVDDTALEADGIKTFSTKSKKFFIPDEDKIFIILNEQVLLKKNLVDEGKYLNIVPLTYQEYSRLIAKPFKYPAKDLVWKLTTNIMYTTSESLETTEVLEEPTESTVETTYGKLVELIALLPSDALLTYTIRYIKLPYPIIIWDNSEYTGMGVTIKGQSTWHDLDTPEEMHEEILQRAVELAKVAWQGDMQSTLTVGERSE